MLSAARNTTATSMQPRISSRPDVAVSQEESSAFRPGRVSSPEQRETACHDIGSPGTRPCDVIEDRVFLESPSAPFFACTLSAADLRFALCIDGISCGHRGEPIQLCIERRERQLLAIHP